MQGKGDLKESCEPEIRLAQITAMWIERQEIPSSKRYSLSVPPYKIFCCKTRSGRKSYVGAVETANHAVLIFSCYQVAYWQE